MSAGDIEDIYELSPLQQGILFHSLYDGDSETYVNQRSFIVEGPVDAEMLQRAWRQTTAAHTALRTSFHWEGLDKPLQVVHRQVRMDLAQHDWSGTADQLERFARLSAQDLATGFDPARPPLQRLHLVRFDERRHGLIWTHHLLLLDGWSVPIFLSDLLGRYLNLTVGTPEPAPAPPYRTYIAWLQGQDLDAAREFWRSTLAGHAEARPPALLLPADPQHPGGTHAERERVLPASFETELRAAAARHRVTVNTVLHAAWALVLQRYNGDTEVMFGATSACRPPELPQVDRMMGLFTNTLPVRVSIPNDGDLGEWLRDLQADYAAIRRYEYSPLPQIKHWVGAPGPQPLFHTLVIFDNYSLEVEAGELARRLSFRPVNAVEKTSQPLVLAVTPAPEFTVRLRHHQERFAPGAIDELLDCFETSLAALTGTDRIAPVADALARAESTQDPPVRYPDAESTLPALIERQCHATPDALAVLTEETSLSYRELFDRAQATAAALAEAGVRPGHVVGVCAHRSPELVIGLLGTLLAGAAYLPLDPSLPPARLAFMVRDSGAGVALAQRATAALARESGVGQVLTAEDIRFGAAGWSPPAVNGSHAAYTIYTSGSTGDPKGVVVTQHAIVNRLLWMQETFPLAPGDRVLQKTPFGFDVSVWEFFWPLLTGATMVLARPGGHQDAEYLAGVIGRQRITTAHFVPSMLRLFLDEPAASRLPALRRIICSGEELAYPLARRCRTLLPEVELHNLYGPTEAAVDVTWWDCSRTEWPDRVPIGDPIANTLAYVLDRRLLEAPDNVAGELYLGGVQLARGYLNRPGLTAANFVAHPLAGSGGRLYRTGDKVRRLPDGTLEFLGRLDQQVKIHGYRIELGEIEQVLIRHPSVREAAVVVRERPGGGQLAGYVTGIEADPQALRDHLRRHLPRYMVPATITVLPAMPLTHNGKLDRRGLPDPARTGPAGDPVAAPATAEQESVAAVYRDVLDLREVDVTASFFDLGGTSYDAVRAIRRIPGATVGLLAANPSVRELAAALREANQDLLLRLTPPGPAAHTLVCVPFGGGSAITYQPLARAVSGQAALLAASVPGHDIGGDPQLRPLEEVARDCAEAAGKLTDGPISVYGHCAGVGMAVELVRRLEESGRQVRRLFVGGSFPFYEPGPIGRWGQRMLRRLTPAGRVTAATIGDPPLREGPETDRAEMRYLQSIGGFDGVVDEETLSFVMRAFRHDVAQSRRYFTTRWGRGSDTPPLVAPITFIAGTADPLTPRYRRRVRMWRRFSHTVELAEVPGGGHYFHQQEPNLLSRLLITRLH